MCMEVIICQLDSSLWKLDDISDPWHEGTSNQLRWGKECAGNSSSFWVEFCKTLPSQNRIFLTFQNCGICIFHISVFVNTTAMVVNSYTILHMCVEVIICQSDRFQWKVDDISDPWHGGTSNQLRWENECGENSSSFWVEFYKSFPSPNGIFLTFQNCGISHLSHFWKCQYYSYGSE